MGRVARYKKIKACDPFSSKNSGRGKGAVGDADTVGVWGLGENGRKAKKRSRTAQKLRTLRKKNPLGAVTEFDAAPTQLEDDFDLSDLVGSLKREKSQDEDVSSQKPYIVVPKATVAINKTSAESSAAPTTASNLDATAADALVVEKEQAKLLHRAQQQVASKLAEPKFDDRRPGESKRAYNRRVQLETRQIIQKERQMDLNPLKRQRKKEFLNSKKKKRNQSSRGAFLDENALEDEDNNDSRILQPGVENKLWTGEQAVAERARATQVHFGEQAERPPVFHQLPRGAKKSKGNVTTTTTTTGKRPGSTLQREEDIEAERQAMDLMRRKVQAQYAAIKAKRKQAGDFHL